MYIGVRFNIKNVHMDEIKLQFIYVDWINLIYETVDQ